MPRIRIVLSVATLVAVAVSVAHGQASQHGVRFFATGPSQQDRARIPIDDDQPGPDQSAPGDVGAGSFTVELWVRGQLVANATPSAGGDVEVAAQTWRNGNILIDRDVAGTSGPEWGISVAGGLVRFGTGSGTGTDVENTIEGSTPVLDGTWHHIACARDVVTGVKRIYIDGALDIESGPGVSQSDLSFPDGGGPGLSPYDPYLVIAADKHDGGKAGFAGYVDELRLWTRALDASDVLSSYDRLISPSAAGLAAWYRFEEGAGAAIADASAQSGPVGTLIAGAPGNGQWTSFVADSKSTAPLSFGLLPPGFQRTTVATGFTEPTGIAFFPDGRLLVGERSGVIRVVDNGTLLPTPLITLPTNTEKGERGLLGFAVDPAFPSDPYLYCFYTTTAPKDRVSRFTVTGNQASLASELLLWEHDEPSSDFHHAGGLAFGLDQTLFVAVGDQLDSNNAQDLSQYGGKILRVSKTGGAPADNPFVGVAGVRPEIYAYGLRNPFRIAVDSLTGELYIGDVGGNTSDAFEEVNLGAAGANYGWPLQEGENCYTVDCSPFAAPIWSYAHADPSYYFATPQGSVTMGPVYRAAAFPPEYQGDVFVADYANRFIRRLILDEHGDVTADPVFLATGLAGTPVDVELGPDGALYYVTYGLFFGGVPDTATVYRIAYVGSVNQPPIAVAAATPTSGPTPLSVQFSSAGSFDPDAAPSPLQYLWDFGDGGTATAPNPQHSYAVPGPYTARLLLDDGQDVTASAPIEIAAGNPPAPAITAPAPTLLFEAGKPVTFQGSATDVEDGALPGSAFTWSVVLVHNEHVHPFLGPLSGVTQGSFTPPASGHGPENTHYRVDLTVVDSDALSVTTSIEVFPRRSLLAFGTEPPGIPLFLDGEPLTTPALYEGLVGFQHALSAPPVHVIAGQPYAFRCWSDGGSIDHTVTAGLAGQNLTALYEPLVTSMITATVTAPSRNAQFSPATGQAFQHATNPQALCVGRDGNGVLEAGLEFTLAVPQGAFILDARIEVTAVGSQLLTPKATVRAFDVGDAPPFVAGSPTPITGHAPLTQTGIGWVLPEFLIGQNYTSPDLSSLVAKVVSRPDWAAGNHIGFALDGASTVSQQWRCFGNVASSTPAKLRVTYASLPPSGGPCALPCGFATYGPTAKQTHKLQLVGTGSPKGGGVAKIVTTGLGAAPGVFEFFGIAPGSTPFYGGTLLIAPAQLVVVFFVPGSDGKVQWNLPLSTDPTFTGLSFYLQSVAADATQPQGAAFSNGLELTLCPP